MGRILAAAFLVASCSPPAHPKKPPRPERVAREPDDVRAGAVAIPLVDGRATYRGTLDGPGSDTVDWLYVDCPAVTGELAVAVHGPRDVTVRAFDGDTELLSIPRWPDKAGPPSITVPAVPPRVFLEVVDLETDAGPYDLSLAFVVTPPAPADAGVVAPPDAALRYCAVGEVSDECRRAPICDWNHVDPANPRCAPEQRPR